MENKRTKNQHYVPQYYFRLFFRTNEKNFKVKYMSKKQKGQNYDYIRKIASQNNFYENKER